MTKAVSERTRQIQRAACRKYYRENKEELIKKHIEYMKRNPDKVRLWNTRRINKDKDEVIEVLGRKCRKCGISDPRVLQIDHVNGGGAKERKAVKSRYAYYKIIMSNLDRYQLLYANCNWIKRHERKEW